MATISFLYRGSQKSGKVELHLRMNIDTASKRIARSGIFVEVSEWNNNAHKVIVPTKLCDEDTRRRRIDVQNRLNALESFVEERASRCTPEELTTDWLKTQIDMFLCPDKYVPRVVKPKTLFEAVEDYISKAPSKIQKNGKPISKGTIFQYGQMKNFLKAFAKAKKKHDYQIEEVDKDFYNDFVKFLYRKGLMLNTIGKHIKNIKAVINSLPLSQRSQCGFLECAKLKEDVDNIYLNEEELRAIAEFPININYYNNVRNQFLLLSWTGCRYSDLNKLTKENIIIKEGKQYFKLEQQKTDNEVVIPILPEAKRILELYDYQLPKVMPNQDFNRYIKEIAQEISTHGEFFFDEVAITHTINGKRTTERKKRYQLISAHSARRSFATNLYKRGYPTLAIMKVTGHKTEKAFLTYIKVSGEENAKMILDKATSSESRKEELLKQLAELDNDKLVELLKLIEN